MASDLLFSNYKVLQYNETISPLKGKTRIPGNKSNIKSKCLVLIEFILSKKLSFASTVSFIRQIFSEFHTELSMTLCLFSVSVDGRKHQ